MVNKYSNSSNPIEQEKALDNLISFFKGFNKFFDNEMIDNIVRQEFKKEYALLPLLVKAQLYYDEH